MFVSLEWKDYHMGVGGLPSGETALTVDMVQENNAIRLIEIKEKVTADNVNFKNHVSLTTLDWILQPQRVWMKQTYSVCSAWPSLTTWCNAKKKKRIHLALNIVFSVFFSFIVGMMCGSVYNFAVYEQLFWFESLGFQKRIWGFAYVDREKSFRKMEKGFVKYVSKTVEKLVPWIGCAKAGKQVKTWWAVGHEEGSWRHLV